MERCVDFLIKLFLNVTIDDHRNYLFVNIKLWLSFRQKHFPSSLLVANGRFHFSPPTDFLAFRSVRMLFGHNWILIRSQNQSTLALVLRTPNATPIRTTIFSIQIIVDNNQRMAALAINEIQTLKNGNKERTFIFSHTTQWWPIL